MKGRKAAVVCNNSPEMLKAGSEAMIHRFYAVMSVWQFSALPLDWKRKLVWKEKGTDCAKQSACLSAAYTDLTLSAKVSMT